MLFFDEFSFRGGARVAVKIAHRKCELRTEIESITETESLRSGAFDEWSSVTLHASSTGGEFKQNQKLVSVFHSNFARRINGS